MARVSKSDKRQHERSQEYGSCVLQVSLHPSGDCACEAQLWDFSQGGLGMDCPREYRPGETVSIRGDLHAKEYSMAIEAVARVAYSRRSADSSYRVGVAFLDVSLRPVSAVKRAAASSS